MKKLFTSLQIIFKEFTYVNIAVGISLITGYVSYWLFYKTTTIPTFLENVKNGDFGDYSYAYGITYLATTLLIIVLSGISIAAVVWLYNHSQLGRGKTLGANAGGLLAAAFGMGCPVCGAFLFSMIGITGGLSLFPLQGLELKFLSLGLLLGSTVYALLKVHSAIHCKDCEDITHSRATVKTGGKRLVILPLEKLFIPFLIALFFTNQFFITKTTAALGISDGGFISQLFGIKKAAGTIIIAPKLNPDGKTTSLVEQQTITDVPGNPNSGDALADAKVVMIPTGKPFYAPDDISFDDPINAQNKWGAYENNINLSGALQSRYEGLISTFTCNYCCGGPNNVTTINNCGCRHAKAWRGMFKYMLQTYGDKYTDEQLKGEAFRWTGIWYPKGVLEDYLLATGKESALPHETHGGAGSGGRHGL